MVDGADEIGQSHIEVRRVPPRGLFRRKLYAVAHPAEIKNSARITTTQNPAVLLKQFLADSDARALIEAADESWDGVEGRWAIYRPPTEAAIVAERLRVMNEGNALLTEVLEPAGFVLASTEVRRGSGGSAVRAVWTRSEQSIELHLRYGLGIVDYRWGEEVFSHKHICGALRFDGEYPGFGDDPLGAYRRLAADLATEPLSQIVNDRHAEVLVEARAWTPPGRVLP